MIGTSFKPAQEIISAVSPWPGHWTTQNYKAEWNANPEVAFGTFFMNSLIVSVGAVVGNLISCSLTAYALARLRFRLRGLFFAIVIVIVIVTILLPYHVLIIPQYAIFRYFGWVNTFLPLIVPKFLATDAFFIFLNSTNKFTVPVGLGLFIDQSESLITGR